MPSYKLTYFNVRGRGEITRLLFAQAGVDFEDCRITGDQFRAMKDKLPLGQLPVLEVDGKRPIPQSKAIERYLAREFGLYGKDKQESMLIDVIGETVLDMEKLFIEINFEKDDEKKAKMITEFADVKSVPGCKFLVRGLEEKSKGKGYFVGNSVTLGDIQVFGLFDFLDMKVPQMVAKYPVLKAFVDRMRKEPKIAAWIAKRPVSDF